MSFKHGFNDIIKEQKIISRLTDHVLFSFLEVLKEIGHYNLDGYIDIIVSINEKWEELNLGCLFSDKQCDLIKNLEFIENISLGE